MVGVFIIATTLVVTGVLQVNSVIHANGSKPEGWVANAVHVGPGSGSTLPGWGWGDKNHDHSGPPGKSTFPDTGQGDDHADDKAGDADHGNGKDKD